MHRIKLLILLITAVTSSCSGQNGKTTSAAKPEKWEKADFTEFIKAQRISTFNRNLSLLIDVKYNNAIHLDEKAGDGVAWLRNTPFSEGVIEFDVKGRNVVQESFVGLAFHGINDSTMDVVYFRPFNFQAEDTARRNHSVQYVSLPTYDWQRLRSEFPGKYEHAIHTPPPAEDWFHARVVVEGTLVSVYVNDDSEPELVVEKLNKNTEGMIGLWVGNNSDGNFANLKITRR